MRAPACHSESEFLQHDRQRNFQHLDRKHRAYAGAWPRAKRHVFILRWINVSPAIGTEDFRFRINFRQMMGEKMAANHAGAVTERKRSHWDGIVISGADGKRHRWQNTHAFLDDAVENESCAS